MTLAVAEEDAPKKQALAPTASNIQIFGRHFVDQHNRVLSLRGANVGAASKVPNAPGLPVHRHAEADYIGRPFPLDEADEHWRRLKSWGLTFLRINVTWDAIAHAGPGQYDTEYLAYLRALLQSMEKHGLVAYVAFHQDVWSRYCGGSGAPGWTLEAAGFDLSDDGEKLVKSGATFLDGIRGGRLKGERGLWPTGYQKLAAATMNTLFWGGATFAPSLVVEKEAGVKVNIQQYLQDAFLGATSALIDAVGDLSTVLGIELMNEPHPGFIGLATIHEWNYNTDLHLGDFPSPLQSFSMGAGHATPQVPHYTRSFPFPTRRTGYVTGNPTNTSVWRDGQCPWENEAAWKWSDAKSKPIALQEDFFTKDQMGKKVEFYDTFYWPFVKKWEKVVARSKIGTAKGRGKMRMVEVVPNEFCPQWPSDARPKNLVYAPHWYDLNALFKKQLGYMTVNVQALSRGAFVWNALYWGKGIDANYELQIKNIVKEARAKLGDVPIVFGECGVPMDLNKEKALRTGNWKEQERMMNAMIKAFEASLVAFNLWTYNPPNRDDYGDSWNAENFSWYSNDNRDKQVTKSSKTVENLDAGARLLDAIVRPYAIATAGTPLELSYDPTSSVFFYRYMSPIRFPAHTSKTPATSEITELFIPRRAYSEKDIAYHLSPGGHIQFDFEAQRAYIWFVDIPDERWAKKTEKGRRVDIWIPARSGSNKGISRLQILVLVISIALALRALVHFQRKQWDQDEMIFGKADRWF